ncbi:MAG: metallophosphoesterase [Clostridia bacterium]|nr:metallophosphoesterase [Clostridia bacterium]
MPRKEKKIRAKRPHLLGKLLAMLPVSCALLYPIYLAAQLDTVTVDYLSDALPEPFDGLRIVYLSDIHYGAFLKEDRVKSLVDRVNALQPDLILMGGDYSEDSEGAIRFFEQVKPAFRARIAVLGTVGNHDRTLPEENLQTLKHAMADQGVIPLVNDVWTAAKEGKTLAIAGVDDYYNGYPDLNKVAALSRGADFTIFLPHTPDLLPQVYDQLGSVFYQLALCGHTHGGQVALFGHSIRSSADTWDRYRSGWYHERGADILVTNGVGTSGLPVRLGARPQIHLITMKRR